MQSILGVTTPMLQQAIYMKEADTDNVSTYFYDIPTTYKKRNAHVFPAPPLHPLRIVNLVEIFSSVDPELAWSPFIEGGQFFRSPWLFVWLQQADSFTLLPVVSQVEGAQDTAALVTMYIVADLESTEGRELVRAALNFVVSLPALILHYGGLRPDETGPHSGHRSR